MDNIFVESQHYGMCQRYLFLCFPRRCGWDLDLIGAFCNFHLAIVRSTMDQ